MKKIYILVLLFVCIMMYPQQIISQSNQVNSTSLNIRGLTIYPNPIAHGKLTITSTLNLNKEIEIFNVLGKRVFKTRLLTTQLNIETLKSGVYILNISENNIIETRKLVIK